MSAPAATFDPKEIWEQFRRDCFLQVVDSVFHWSAGHFAEAHIILLHLREVDGFMYDLTKRALIITAYGARHVIPIAQLTVESMEHVQTAQSGHERDSMAALHRIVYERYGIDKPLEGTSDAATLH